MINEMRGYVGPRLRDITKIYMDFLCDAEDKKQISSDIRIRFTRVEKMYFRGKYGVDCPWYSLRIAYGWLCDGSLEDNIKVYEEMTNSVSKSMRTVSMVVSISLFFIWGKNRDVFLSLAKHLEVTRYDAINLKELKQYTKSVIKNGKI